MRHVVPCVLATLAVAAVLVSASPAQDDREPPTRARAMLASSPEGEEGAVAPRCPPCGRRAVSGGVSMSAISIGDGEATASVVQDGDTTARASAVVRSVSLLDGLVTAYGIRRTAVTSGNGVEVTGRVEGLKVGDRLFEDDIKLPDQVVQLPDGLGRVNLNSGPDGLRITLARAYDRFEAGAVIHIARVRVKVSAQSNVTDDEQAPAEDEGGETPSDEQEPEADRDSGRAEAAKRRRQAEREKRAKPRTKNLKRRKAPEGVNARLTGGGFVFPVYGGGIHYSDDWGAARQIGAHQGNDVFGPFGAPALAVTDGRIVKVGTLPISGNRLWLVTEQGDAFFYAHLSAFSPAAVNGRHVKAGEVLGFVGNTGDAEPTPPHVHFEVHPGGLTKDAVNPFAFLRAWQTGSDVPPGAWLTRYGRDTSQRPGALVEVEDFIARQGG